MLPANQDDDLVQCVSESADGVFSRVWVAKSEPPATTGLWHDGRRARLARGTFAFTLGCLELERPV